ncbi:MAG: hypothetical protein KBF73_06575, partial [Flavobacteriales bacterium]|nr:hypothetical protein [Flavobacteriales bacterium]
MRDEIEELPIYQKGDEIGELVRRIVDLADEDNDDLQRVCADMLVNAYDLAVKVVGAEGADLY